jgi:hypothetical protein
MTPHERIGIIIPSRLTRWQNAVLCCNVRAKKIGVTTRDVHGQINCMLYCRKHARRRCRRC